MIEFLPSPFDRICSSLNFGSSPAEVAQQLPSSDSFKMGSSDYVRSAIRKLALTVGSGRTVGANSRYAVGAPEQVRSEYREGRRDILEMETFRTHQNSPQKIGARAGLRCADFCSKQLTVRGSCPLCNLLRQRFFFRPW
jgi:hypothetical protein